MRAELFSIILAIDLLTAYYKTERFFKLKVSKTFLTKTEIF